MSSVLEDIDKRTQMMGQNRFELLLFRLHGSQNFGINVFKVREIMHCPPLTHLPKSHPAVCGVASIRGKTLPVIDLSLAIGGRSLGDSSLCFVIVTEYNRCVQGLLVKGVEQIINMKWESVRPPPKGAGADNYLTAVTQVGDQMIEILDVEKVFSEIIHSAMDVSSSVVATAVKNVIQPHILVVDDSSVARNQIKRTLEQINISSTLAVDGREALEILKTWVATQDPLMQRLNMVISDVEMPEMDGYTLTAEIRKNEDLKDIYVLLHSSLSGVFNDAMIKRVGANQFIAKFSADDLAIAVLKRLA